MSLVSQNEIQSLCGTEYGNQLIMQQPVTNCLTVQPFPVLCLAGRGFCCTGRGFVCFGCIFRCPAGVVCVLAGVAFVCRCVLVLPAACLL